VVNLVEKVSRLLFQEGGVCALLTLAQVMQRSDSDRHWILWTGSLRELVFSL
jgi:hypothetical protein